MKASLRQVVLGFSIDTAEGSAASQGACDVGDQRGSHDRADGGQAQGERLMWALGVRHDARRSSSLRPMPGSVSGPWRITGLVSWAMPRSSAGRPGGRSAW